MRLPWLLLLSVACQTTFVAPEGADPTEGRALFDEDTEAARALAERIATEHARSPRSRLLAALPDARHDLATRSVGIAGGRAHVRLEQTVDGVPVFGAQAIVHLEGDGSVRAVTDRWQRGLRVDTTPTVAEADAVAAAVAAEGGGAALGVDRFVMRHRNRDRLVWRVRLDRLDAQPPSLPVVFVDAHTAEVVRRLDDVQAATTAHATTDYNGAITVPVDAVDGVFHLRSADDGAGTYTLGNTTSLANLAPVTSATVDGFTDPVALDAHFGAVQTLAYFAAMHGRKGVDGAGGPTYRDGVLTSIVHVGTNHTNASWAGTAVLHGDGDGYFSLPWTSLDIVAHELTHGITQHTAGLVYEGESGALNESFSDVFAVLVEQWVEGDGPDRWLIGEDFFSPHVDGDALRYVADPMKDFQSRDHYGGRYTGPDDHGGVHLNSGIGNLAFHLMVEGGRHPYDVRHTVDVEGIGFDAAGAIAWEVLSERLTPTAGFHDARAAWIAVATERHGEGSREVRAVTDAWAEVGVGLPYDGPVPARVEPVDDDGVTLLLSEVVTQAAGATALFPVEVPAGVDALVVRLSGGSGDADLGLRFGEAPDAEHAACRPRLEGSEEACEVLAPAPGTWFVAVEAYDEVEGVLVQAEALSVAD